MKKWLFVIKIRITFLVRKGQVGGGLLVLASLEYIYVWYDVDITQCNIVYVNVLVLFLDKTHFELFSTNIQEFFL